MKTNLPLLAAAALLAFTPLSAYAQTGNTNYGSNALSSLTTGSNNTAFGDSALYSTTTTDGNTAIGFSALYSNTGGYFNLANGGLALYSNTTGNANTAIGFYALYSNTTGYYNIATGIQALIQNTTGGFNIATGTEALYSNSEGLQNVAIGNAGLFSNTTGNYNIALGYLAGGNLTTGNNNIDIGNQGVADESATIRIGGPGIHTATYVAGIVGVTTSTDDAVAVLIDSNGQLGTVSSSHRYKEDIADMGDASARLLALRPVTFHYKKSYANGAKPIQYGLIAEEVAVDFPELAVINQQGNPETVKYQNLAPMLLNEFQKEHKRVAELEKRMAELEAKDRERETRLTKLEQLLPPAGRPVDIPVVMETAAK